MVLINQEKERLFINNFDITKEMKNQKKAKLNKK